MQTNKAEEEFQKEVDLTEEEIERMLSMGKQVFLYFLDKPLSPSKIDLEQ